MLDICSPSSGAKKIAVPTVVILICFLAFSSQLLFSKIAPQPLEPRQALIFNTLIAFLFIAYARSCLTNPGVVPPAFARQDCAPYVGSRWCEKCSAWKPPRAHHCRHCKGCVLKMDHHCPWTANCVGHRTLPHFMRFLVYATVALCYLEYFLFIRVFALFKSRHLPHYLGPSLLQLTHLVTLTAVNSITLLALLLLTITCIQSLATNITTIEELEIERHRRLLKRARKNGGYLHCPDGRSTKLVKQEFPYDIGIWSNIVQGMGTANVLAWFWPFSVSPSHESGLDFKVNGFDDPSTTWPPPDPDRMPIMHDKSNCTGMPGGQNISLQAKLDATPRGQTADFEQRQRNGHVNRRGPFLDQSEYASIHQSPLNDDSGSESTFDSDVDYDEGRQLTLQELEEEMVRMKGEEDV